jgi:hypothetical protein
MRQGCFTLRCAAEEKAPVAHTERRVALTWAAL